MVGVFLVLGWFFLRNYKQESSHFCI